MAGKTLPAALPVDNTPLTYTGTKVKAFLLDAGATSVISAVVTTTTASAANSGTAQATAVPNVTVPAGSSLNFGGVVVVLTADAPLTAVAAPITFAPTNAAIPNGTTANYSNMRQIPTTEDISPTMSDDEETIKIQGRATPIRVMNGKDFKCTLKTIAGITDPVVKELTIAGQNLSGGTGQYSNLKRLMVQFDDGLALLALCNIGAAMPSGKAGAAQRYDFSANSTGALYWTDQNEAAPVWRQIGGV